MTVAVALLVIFFIGSAVCAIAAGGIPAFAGTIRQKEVLFALRFITSRQMAEGTGL